MVVKHERVVFAHGYGLADLKTGEAVSTRTLFNVGSLSKTFVASAILQLQERGKLSVEDNLLGYFPGFKHKEGSQGGFRCSYITLPDHDVLLIVLSNAPRDVVELTDEIIRQLAAAAWLD